MYTTYHSAFILENLATELLLSVIFKGEFVHCQERFLTNESKHLLKAMGLHLKESAIGIHFQFEGVYLSRCTNFQSRFSL